MRAEGHSRTEMPTKALGLALALLASSVMASAQSREPVLSARLAPDPVGLDQETILEIRIEVAAMRLLRVSPSFELHNLKVVAGPFQEQSMQFVNGAISNATSLRWRLRPLEIGEATVTEIVVQVGDRTLTANPLTTTVQQDPVAEAQPPARRPDPLDEFFRRSRDPLRPRAAGEPELYLRVETNPGDPFVGEPVHYTLYLFTRNDVTAVTAEELPAFEGFWKEEPEGDSRPKRAETVTIDGRKWMRVALLERVLYPLRPGAMEIGPATMAFQVDVDTSGFFRDRRSVRRTSPAARLTVRPLPEGAGSVGVPVGRVTLASRLEPESLETGEAARLEVVARSRGNLRRISDPSIQLPDGLEVYPPQGEIDRRFTGSGVEFTRKWSWVIVPRRPGSYDLPPVTIPYFDPQSESWVEASSGDVSLEVLPAVTVTSPPRTTAADTRLHPLREAVVAPLERRSGSAAGSWLLLVGVLTVAVVAAADLRSRPGGRVAPTDTQPTAAKSTRSASRRALREAVAAVPGGDSRRAALEIENILGDYLAQRWGISPSVAADNWPQRLAGSGLPSSALAQLEEISHDLHYLRFAPQLSQSEELARDLKAKTSRWIRSLPR